MLLFDNELTILLFSILVYLKVLSSTPINQVLIFLLFKIGIPQGYVCGQLMLQLQLLISLLICGCIAKILLRNPILLLILSIYSVLGWRLGLQVVTGAISVTFILGTFYRSASLYHPQRRAILHIKNQKRKIKDKNKIEDKIPFFDFSTLKSKTVRILLISTGISAFGINTPLFYLAYQAEVKKNIFTHYFILY